MKKLQNSSIARLDDDDKIDEYYKEAALDALLYWTNSTSTTIGNNATMSFLTEMLSTCIIHMVAADQVDRARAVIFKMLNESFDMISENSSKDFSDSADKKNMN